jgi:thiol-disulfide isomerase/thioredoxin
MFVVISGGQNILRRVPWLTKNLEVIQKIFGLIMILTALGILFNYDRKLQTIILERVPNYSASLTKLENNALVTNQLIKAETKGPKAPELIAGGAWFNSQPLTLASLKGKVVLLDFWTYTCINCQRTLPYLKTWYEKYKDKGLVIIGIHAPEFEFEKSAINVQRAITDFGLTYPVMQDNDFATWRAFNNQYWPAKYLLDAKGNIRYTHFGEGDYDESEKMIQKLLIEAGSTDVPQDMLNPAYKVDTKTPETYLGYARLAGFASEQPLGLDRLTKYSAPQFLGRNSFAFEGDWLVTKEYANPQANTKLYFKFEAKDVFLVMRPKTGSAKLQVYLDDNLVKEVVVDADRLYDLIKLPSRGEHVLRLEFKDANIEVFAFTFG